MGLDMEGLAAAAATLLVRITEHEAGLQLLLHIIHLGAEDEQGRLGIDQHGNAVLLDHFVRRLLLVGIFDGVAEAGTALAAYADADPDRWLAALLQQILHAVRRRFGQVYRLRTRSCHGSRQLSFGLSVSSVRAPLLRGLGMLVL